jgi:hypothetical protein
LLAIGVDYLIAQRIGFITSITMVCGTIPAIRTERDARDGGR